MTTPSPNFSKVFWVTLFFAEQKNGGKKFQAKFRSLLGWLSIDFTSSRFTSSLHVLEARAILAPSRKTWGVRCEASEDSTLKLHSSVIALQMKREGCGKLAWSFFETHSFGCFVVFSVLRASSCIFVEMVEKNVEMLWMGTMRLWANNSVTALGEWKNWKVSFSARPFGNSEKESACQGSGLMDVRILGTVSLNFRLETNFHNGFKKSPIS